MRKFPWFLLLMLCITAHLSWAEDIRDAVWAGKFYHGQPEVLTRHVYAMLQQAGAPTSGVSGLKALIAPHAGYVYSGPVAAHAYRLIQNQGYDTVVILGTAHRLGFKGCSIYKAGGYKTPLGVVDIDEPLAQEFSKATGFDYIPAAHQQEHSIEVQIPFIQVALPNAKIVPILIGIPSGKTVKALAEAMAKILPEKNAIVIVSTDMSHYLSKSQASRVDANTISLIQALDTSQLLKQVESNENIMCGGTGVITALQYAQALGPTQAKLLDYADSSAAGGPDTEVVGYMAVAIYAGSHAPAFSLSLSEKQELLEIARTSINLFIRDKQMFSSPPKQPGLQTEKGAFVTLKKNGRLRGCIGFTDPIAPLYQTVSMAAIYAASKDSRFQPVAVSELSQLEIEISVLTPPTKITNPELIQVGKHGLIISKAGQSGLLLPQVPVENQWSRKTFLQQACLKAGLPKDAWESGADLYVFEALVFH